MPAKRDPFSELLDTGARRLLERAYASPGAWVSTRLGDPGLRVRTLAMQMGVDLDGPDNPSTRRRSGGTNARSRWGRAFVRSLYYQHKWYSRPGPQQSWIRRPSHRETGALRVEVGRHLGPTGVIPAGRVVRVQLARGGAAKEAAVARLEDRDRIYRPSGSPGGRWSDPGLRDWA